MSVGKQQDSQQDDIVCGHMNGLKSCINQCSCRFTIHEIFTLLQINYMFNKTAIN
jgi:hypothetical protein